MDRVRLQHGREERIPSFPLVLKKWTWNQIKRNLWRVFPDFDVEDMYSEALLKWCQVCNRYPQIDEPKHLAYIFRLSYTRRIHTLANSRKKKVGVPFSVLGNNTQGFSGAPLSDAMRDSVAVGKKIKGGEPSEEEDCISVTELEVMKYNAPSHIKNLLEQMVDTEIKPRPMYIEKPRGLLNLCRRFGIRVGKRVQETENEYLCRVAGVDPEKINMFSEIMQWLSGEKPGVIE